MAFETPTPPAASHDRPVATMRTGTMNGAGHSGAPGELPPSSAGEDHSRVFRFVFWGVCAGAALTFGAFAWTTSPSLITRADLPPQECPAPSVAGEQLLITITAQAGKLQVLCRTVRPLVPMRKTK